MLIFISLFLLFLAGAAACGIPKDLFNLETTLSSGKLQIWLTFIKAFGVPLSLFLLRFTKNHFITLASLLWGLTITFLSLIVVFDISNMAPSVNIYGVIFVFAILISAVSLTLFSGIEFAAVLKQRLSKLETNKTPSTSPSSEEIESTYQTPTNPS